MESTKEALKKLKQLAEEITTEREKLHTSTNIVDVCKFYRDVRDIHELIDSMNKIIGDVKSEFSEIILPDLMEALQVDSINMHGRTFSLTAKPYFSIPVAKQAEGFKWLKEHGFNSLIQEGVNPQSLTSALNGYIEEKGEMPPEEAISNYIKKSISVRKSSRK